MSLRSWLRLKPKAVPILPEAQRLGVRSPLVLAKIGHDMRQHYDGLIEQPLPEDIRRVVDQLPEPETPVLLPVPKAPKDDSA